MDQAAEAVWAAWVEGRTLEALPEGARPRTLAEGYAAQRALAGRAGPSLGWKLAATSAAGQAHIGVDGPLAGRLFERFRHDAPATVPAQGVMLVCEAELCFRLGADVPPRAEPYPWAELAGAVEALHLAVELPDSRLARFETAGAPALAADDACAGLFVLGPEAPPRWRDLDLAAHPTRILRNGEVAAEGVGGNALGDPRTALAWLASHEHAEGLRAGDLVTTGTTTVPVPYAAGDRIVADFGALGRVEVTLGERARRRGGGRD